MVLENIKSEIRKEHLSGFKKLLFTIALVFILTPLEWVIASSLSVELNIPVIKIVAYIKVSSWVIIIWLAPKLIKKYTRMI